MIVICFSFLFWIMLMWTLMCRFSCKCMASFFKHDFIFLSLFIPKCRIIGSYGILLYLTFWGVAKWFLSAFTILYSHQPYMRLPIFSDLHSTYFLIVGVVFHPSHSNRCEVLVHCALALHFTGWLVMLNWASFPVLWRNVYSDPLPIYSSLAFSFLWDFFTYSEY